MSYLGCLIVCEKKQVRSSQLRNRQLDWTLVVAMSKNGIIGRDGDLPWRLRSDLKRFKSMTMGHCLLMGRKTYESIGRPLPGRQTIVLSRNGMENLPEGVSVAADLDEVESLVQSGRKVMVVGGAQVYRSALPRCAEIWLTRVQTEIEGDTAFPEVDWDAWTLQSAERFEPSDGDDWPTQFELWKRKIDGAKT